jgi:superkiller protein 3
MIGPIALAAAGIAKLFSALKDKQPWLEPVFCGTLLIVLGVLTWRQSGIYVNSETLWRTTIARNPSSFLAYNNLGFLLDQRGQVDEALTYFRRAVEIQPDYAVAQNNLGNALSRTGHLQEAIGHYREALRLEPDDVPFHSNLGTALARTGHLQEAMEQFREALRLAPDDAAAHYKLGNALLLTGQLQEAIEQYQEVLRLKPDDVMTHGSLGVALAQTGQLQEAIVQFQMVLQIQPDNVRAQYRLAWILATCPDGSLRDGPQAVELAQQANQLSGGHNPAILGTLAAAYAEAGRFSEATAAAQKALQLADSQTNAASMVKDLQAQIKDYEKNIPFRDSRLTNTNARPSQ